MVWYLCVYIYIYIYIKYTFFSSSSSSSSSSIFFSLFFYFLLLSWSCGGGGGRVHESVHTPQHNTRRLKTFNNSVPNCPALRLRWVRLPLSIVRVRPRAKARKALALAVTHDMCYTWPMSLLAWAQSTGPRLPLLTPGCAQPAHRNCGRKKKSGDNHIYICIYILGSVCMHNQWETCMYQCWFFSYI